MEVNGTVAPGFEPVRDAFDNNFSQFGEVGAAFAVFKDGQCLVDIWGGYRDESKTTAWTRDTLVNVWSTTKGPTAMCIAKLVESGALSYDDRVATHWPEFAVHGKADVTVGQLMSHQAGLCGLRDPITVDAFYDHEKMAKALAAMEPLWEPGTSSGYHAMTYGNLAGELVFRLTGRSLGTFFQEEIAQPCGIDFFIGLPESEELRVAPMIASPNTSGNIDEMVTSDVKRAALANPDMSPLYPNDRAWREAEIPAAGGHGSAHAIAKIYGLLANASGQDKPSPLTETGISAMTEVQINNVDLVLGVPMQWGAGVIMNSLGIAYGPNKTAFGHSGFGGSFGCYDPESGLGIGYAMNLMGENLAGDPRAMSLISAVYDSPAIRD